MESCLFPIKGYYHHDNNYKVTKLYSCILPAAHHTKVLTAVTNDCHLEVLRTDQEYEHWPKKVFLLYSTCRKLWIEGLTGIFPNLDCVLKD